MLISVGLPTCMEGMMYPVPFATAEEVIDTGLLAEKLGYHSIWGNDHMTTQSYVRAQFEAPPNFWEPLITYAYIAAQTKNLKFGTGMLVLPMRRDIVVVAKQVATLDVLSRGRLILGVGVGAYREEFEALQPDWKVNRGELLEEAVQAIRMLFDYRSATFNGKYLSFNDVEMYPKPVQVPLPIYFGGNNQNAVRRTAMYGQGWMPALMPFDQLSKSVEIMHETAVAHGRDPKSLEVAMQLVCFVAKTHEEAVSRFRQSQMYEHLVSLRSSTLKDQVGANMEEINLIGSADEIIEKVKRYQEAGLTHLCGTYFCAQTVDELHQQMQVFAEEVVPNL